MAKTETDGDEDGVTLRPPPPWAGTRLATVLTIASLGLTAAVAMLGTWSSAGGMSPSRLILAGTTGLIALGAFVAAAQHLLAQRQARIRSDVERCEKIRRQLRTAMPNGKLPRLQEMKNEVFGPTPTVYSAQKSAPYVARPQADAWLRETLTVNGPPYPFIVLTGASKAGKSRTALEAVRESLGNRPVVMPRDGQALSELVRLDPPLMTGSSPVLVWLDDLLVGDLDHLTADILEKLTGCAIVVSTMTTQHWNEIYFAGSEITAVSRYALRQAARYELPFELTEDEKAEARNAYPDHADEFGSPVVSIAESLVGGEQLLAKYDAGRDKNPTGYALVQLAIDWRRCGLSRPIPRTALDELSTSYVRRIKIDGTANRTGIDSGLLWAMQPVASQVALLRLSPDNTEDGPCFEVLDYVVAADDAQGGRSRSSRPIPENTWSELLAIVPGYEGLDIGMAAHLRDRPQIALLAFKAAANCGHPDYYSAGAFNLGVLLAPSDEDFDEACDNFEVAIRSGHPTDAPAAAVERGMLLVRRAGLVAAGERARLLAEACKDFQLAITYDHPTESLRAAAELARLDCASHDHEGSV